MYFMVGMPAQTSTAHHVPLSPDINPDICKKELKIMPDTKCEYRLGVALPYRVDPRRGDANFDRKRRTLIVTLPVA